MNLPFWQKSGDALASNQSVRTIRAAALDAERSRLPQMAAALSYRTIFGLLPVLAIGLFVLHRLASPEDLEWVIGKGVDSLGLSTIVVEESSIKVAPVETASSVIFGPPAPPLMERAPTEATASLKQWINEFVERINTISFSAIGIVGVIMLIYAGLGMVVEVERAFNQIYRVPQGRTWGRRLPIYWTLLSLGPIGLFATFFIQQRLGVWVEGITQGRTGVGSGAITLTIIGIASQFLITWAMLLAIYLVVPNTKVRFLPALYGALLAAIIFEASKFAFGKYVEFSGKDSYARLYGSLALIPLFLLWVYFSWLIVLFGVQLAYQLQHGRGRTRAQPIMEICLLYTSPSPRD